MKNIRKHVSLMLAFVLCMAVISAHAVSDEKLQIYFSPHIMNDVTGEIVVDVNLRNKNIAVPESFGEISGLIFGFEYDQRQFKVKRDSSGNIEFITDDKCLISNKSTFKVVENGGTIVFDFTDSTFSDNLIQNDGKLCSFTLISKYPRELWNSFDAYPLRFVPGTVGVVTYNTQSRSIAGFTNLEAIDVNVGAYNRVPHLKTQSVDKHITFTAEKTEIKCDGEIITTDAKAFLEGDNFMLPFRYFADAVGMEVTWNQQSLMAGGYCDYKTVNISLKNKNIYINSVKCAVKALPAEIDGRTYISADVIPEIFQNAVVNVDKETGSADIYIP